MTIRTHKKTGNIRKHKKQCPKNLGISGLKNHALIMPPFGAGNGLSHVAFFLCCLLRVKMPYVPTPLQAPKKIQSVTVRVYKKKKHTWTNDANLPIKRKISQRIWTNPPPHSIKKNTKAENIRKNRLARIQQTMRKPWPRPHALAVQENLSAKVPEQIQAGGSRSFSILSTPGCDAFAVTKKCTGKRPV